MLVLLMSKTFTTALTGEGKPYNRVFDAKEMHPYPRLRRYFPRRGHCYLDKRIYLNTCQKRHVFFSASKN